MTIKLRQDFHFCFNIYFQFIFPLGNFMTVYLFKPCFHVCTSRLDQVGEISIFILSFISLTVFLFIFSAKFYDVWASVISLTRWVRFYIYSIFYFTNSISIYFLSWVLSPLAVKVGKISIFVLFLFSLTLFLFIFSAKFYDFWASVISLTRWVRFPFLFYFFFH